MGPRLVGSDMAPRLPHSVTPRDGPRGGRAPASRAAQVGDEIGEQRLDFRDRFVRVVLVVRCGPGPAQQLVEQPARVLAGFGMHARSLAMCRSRSLVFAENLTVAYSEPRMAMQLGTAVIETR